jgi:hypothetical protein
MIWEFTTRYKLSNSIGKKITKEKGDYVPSGFGSALRKNAAGAGALLL